MKKLLLFFVIFSILGCESTQNKDTEISQIKCPTVFFSSENNVYSYGELENLNLDKVEYIAKFNNFRLSNGCFLDSNNNYYPLDILILIEFLNPAREEINLPVFVLLYDNNEKLIDKQYFRIFQSTANISKTEDNKVFELRANLNILVKKNLQVGSMTIGFVKLKTDG